MKIRYDRQKNISLPQMFMFYSLEPGRRCFENMIKLRILNEITLDYPAVPIVITQVLIKEKGR